MATQIDIAAKQISWSDLPMSDVNNLSLMSLASTDDRIDCRCLLMTLRMDEKLRSTPDVVAPMHNAYRQKAARNCSCGCRILTWPDLLIDKIDSRHAAQLSKPFTSW